MIALRLFNPPESLDTHMPCEVIGKVHPVSLTPSQLVIRNWGANMRGENQTYQAPVLPAERSKFMLAGALLAGASGGKA
eukprot:6928093-Pyramimonas_sp.AAC.1